MRAADNGARLGNYLVDTFLVFLFFAVHSAILYLLFPSLLKGEFMFLKVYPLFVYFAYYFFFEYFLGRTPGKYLSGTKVVDLYGKKPGMRDILVRSVCRLLPIDSLSYIFGIGFHDTVSRTKVVYKNSLD